MADEPTRRRAADRDRRRWNDDRLDDLADQVRRTADELRRFGPEVGKQLVIEARQAGLMEDVEDFKRWITEVENRLRADLAAAEDRQKEQTERVERACAAWSDKLEQALPRLTVVEAKQGHDEQENSQRRNLLYAVAGAFAGAAFGVVGKLLGLL